MKQLPEAVRSGYYAQSQICSQSSVIAWSHRGRFSTAVRLAREIGGARILDFGCGDGTFLGLLAAGQPAPSMAVGAELTSDIVDDCRRRFAGHDALRFMRVADLDREDELGRYDAIYCMEVLEHVVDPAPLLSQFHRLLAPGGSLVISVPIEIGFPVVAKQVIRRIAGWRGIGDYPGTTGYTAAELLRSVIAGSAQHLRRPIFSRADGSTFCDHKGFNWRTLRVMVGARFDLLYETTSPFGSLGPQMGTQRWFVARKKLWS